MLAQHVGVREPIIRPERWILDERRIRRERAGNGEDCGQLLVIDRHQGCRLFGGVFRLGRDRRNGVAVILGLVRRR